MKRDTVYFRQAELLLRVLPFVNEEEVFALKGGTAINFFLRDLPRLSIDIDLTYLPINDREAALTDIDKALLRISERGKPQWDKLGVPGIENLPGVQWKLQNIRRMAPTKHREALRKLRDYLGV